MSIQRNGLRLSVLVPALLLSAGCATGAGNGPGAPVAPRISPLLDPQSPTMNEPAPGPFRVLFRTTKGDFVVRVEPEWAPRGARRFYNLVREGYYDGVRFFRVVDGFVAQFGLHPDPAVTAAWREASIPDDPVREGNRRGTLTFAMAGPDTRTVQLFVNLVDNSRLDAMGFAPFAEVVEGMEVVDALHGEYGEGPPRGSGPDQGRIMREGEPYLAGGFPLLDLIQSAVILP